MGSNVKYKHLSVLKGHLSVDLLTIVEQFEATKDEWKNLFVSCKDRYNVFLCYTWNYTWWKHFGRDYRLAIVTVRENGKLVGIGPFMVKNQLGVNKIEPIGSNKFAYFGLLVSNDREDVIETMAIKLAESFPKGILHFPYYTPENYAINVLAASLWSMGWHEARWVRNVAPYVYGENGFNSYFSQESHNLRYNVRRAEEKMKKIGKIVVSHFAYADFTNSIVERIAKIQRLSWLFRRGVEPVDTPFNKEVIPLLALEGCAEAFILSINEDDVAFILNFCSNKCNHLILLGFDERQKQVSPGKVLMKHCIQHILDRGDKIYDFLFGGGGYKDSWGTRTKQVFRCVLYKGFKGWVLSCFPRLHGTLAKHTTLRNKVCRFRATAGKNMVLRKILWKIRIIRYGNKPM